MRRTHLVVGIVGALAFLASGLYMLLQETYRHELATRMLYRSTHVYLLFSALLNVALGLYLVSAANGWRRWLRHAGSICLVGAPFLMAYAFLTEAHMTDLARPVSQPAVILCLAGMLLHGMSSKRPLGQRTRGADALAESSGVVRRSTQSAVSTS
jgi:hypothetical protein